jgi:hypothetical protein
VEKNALRFMRNLIGWRRQETDDLAVARTARWSKSTATDWRIFFARVARRCKPSGPAEKQPPP